MKFDLSCFSIMQMTKWQWPLTWQKKSEVCNTNIAQEAVLSDNETNWNWKEKNMFEGEIAKRLFCRTQNPCRFNCLTETSIIIDIWVFSTENEHNLFRQWVMGKDSEEDFEPSVGRNMHICTSNILQSMNISGLCEAGRATLFLLTVHTLPIIPQHLQV